MRPTRFVRVGPYSLSASRLNEVIPGAALAVVAFAQGGKVDWVWNAACLLIFLAASLLLLRRPVDMGRHPLFPAVLPFLTWTALAAVFSGDPSASFPAVQKIVASFCMGAWFAFYPTPLSRRGFLLGLAGFGVANAFFVFRRAGGTSAPDLFPGNPVYGGFWMAVAGLVLAAFAVEAGKSWRWRVVSLAGAAGSLAGAALTQSRSVLLGLLAGGGVAVIHRWGRRGALALAAGAALGLAGISEGTVRRWSKAEDPYAFDRPLIWRGAVAGMSARPLLGWGPGRFESLYRIHAQPLEKEIVRFERSTLFAHNDFLQSAATLGIPALIFWLFGLGLFFWLRPAGPWGRGAAASVVCWSVVGFFNFPLFLPVNGLMLGGLLGLTPFSRRPKFETPAGGAPTARLLAGTALAILALASGAVALGEGLGRRVPWDSRWAPDRLARAEALLHPPAGTTAPDPTGARRLYESVADRFPERAEAWRGLAHIASEHENPPRDTEAVRAYQRALRLWPLQAAWRVELAEVLERRGDRAGAWIEAHRTLELEPAFGEAALLLGRLLWAEGDPRGADRWLTGWWARWGAVSAPSGTGSAYREALLRRNSDAFLLERARARLSSGRYREALSLLSDLPMDDPDRLLLEAGCWYYLGDLIRADSLLRRVQRLAPGRRETGVLLEKVRQRRGGVR